MVERSTRFNRGLTFQPRLVEPALSLISLNLIVKAWLFLGTAFILTLWVFLIIKHLHRSDQLGYLRCLLIGVWGLHEIPVSPIFTSTDWLFESVLPIRREFIQRKASNYSLYYLKLFKLLSTNLFLNYLPWFFILQFKFWVENLDQHHVYSILIFRFKLSNSISIYIYMDKYDKYAIKTMSKHNRLIFQTCVHHWPIML